VTHDIVLNDVSGTLKSTIRVKYPQWAATTQKAMRLAGWREANVFSAALLSIAGNSADSCKSFISA
jgi:hypothetical protein